jgi:putative serine protease PepD
MTGLGSGVILSEDGYIITNYHVIEGESSLKVSMNGEQYDAEVVGSDPTSDLAVIKVNGAEGLTPIEVGSSSGLVVGEWVMTVGSPYGMEQSVGTGIVSAVSRSSASLQDTEGGAIYANLIQTDAPINPGNSGGALVDKDGKLVGINTLAASYSGSNAGVGFAIPSDYAISIAKQIINGEEPSHAQLGVSLVTVDKATANRYNLAVEQGAYVAAVSAGAAEAGIEEGDIITKVDGKKVTSATDVILQVRSHNPGDSITVEVNRNGEAKSFDVTLSADTDNKASSSQSPMRNGGN